MHEVNEGISSPAGAATVFDDQTFENAVTQARISRSTNTLTNRSILHAKHVVKELLQLAIEEKADVYVSSGHLNSGCFTDDVLKLGDRLISRGQKITVVVEETDEKKLRRNAFASLVASQSEASLFKPRAETNTEYFSHFIVVDGKGFRFETDHQLAKAVLSFNQPDMAEDLKDEFQYYLSLCIPVFLS